MLRALHLDLKGLPPSAGRLAELPRLVRAAGYDALLVEWENMYPWQTEAAWRAPTCYTESQVLAFEDQARREGISIIPLMQTLGHQEMVLATEGYETLRAAADRCDTLDPRNPAASALLQRMLCDLLRLGSKPLFFHLGGDEAQLPGMDLADSATAELLWKHYEPVLELVQQRGIRPLLWHDMIVQLPDSVLSRIAQAADVVVWGYRGQVQSSHGKAIQRLQSLGAVLWGATAFKGADGASSETPDREARFSNAQDWYRIAETHAFRGLIATGWSRYASHRVVCDPMDAALDLFFAVGSVLRGEPQGAQKEAVQAALQSAGARELHQRCRAAARQLAEHVTTAWITIRSLREQVVAEERDPRRRGSSSAPMLLRNLRHDCRRLEGFRPTLHQAFANLIDPLWIDRWLDERLAPIEDELKVLSHRHASLLDSAPALNRAR